MDKMQEIEVIARAFIMKDDKVLLAHAKDAYNTFLPGGHIEKNEFARGALERELFEELGVESKIGDYVGTLEYFYWLKDSSEVQEINIIFQADIDNYSVTSKEEKLEFLWVEKIDLEKAHLLPEPLPLLLSNWIINRKPFYYSLIESEEMRSKLT